MPSASGHELEPYSARRFARRYAGRLAATIALTASATFLGLANPWLVQQLFDCVLVAKRAELLWTFAVVFLGVAALRFALEVLHGQIYSATASRLLLDLQRDFLAHLERLPLSYFAGARFGELATRFQRDLGQIQQFATGVVPGLLASSMTLVGAIAWGLSYDPRLFALACAPLPIAVWIARRMRGRVEEWTRRTREHAGAVNSDVAELLGGMRTVRSFGRERGALSRFVGRSHELLRASLGFQRQSSIAAGVPRMCLVAATAVVYVAGGRSVIGGELELGELLAQSMYLSMLFGPLMSLGDVYLQLAQLRVSLERVREVRAMAAPFEDRADAFTPDEIQGRIEFRDVSFRHQSDVLLLEGLSFAIAPGERVALVGPSGAGKSTVVDLLFRFAEPQAGSVQIDGRDVRELRMRSVRRAMAVVPQDVFLFNATIAENIRYGRSDASDGEVAEVARAVGLLEPSASLTLDTEVGERGTKLSGGQRQRVAIARALLRRPRILVLDEATTSLDSAADAEVRAAIELLARDATTIVIAHRPSDGMRCGRVIELRELVRSAAHSPSARD
jgi:ABC-type multidrug transport system fused ATPase/permease subunit